MHEVVDVEPRPEGEKVYRGAIVLFYKDTPEGRWYLVAHNAVTGNVSLVSGSEEKDDDNSLERTAVREVSEELGIPDDAYALRPLPVSHRFVFGPKKVERAGHRGEYQVFVGNLTAHDGVVGHTSELTGTQWLSEEEARERLSFPDLKDVFTEAVREIGR